MGKGDRKTKRGKIFKGSFGRLRPKKQKNIASLHGGEIKVAVKKPKAKKEEE